MAGNVVLRWIFAGLLACRDAMHRADFDLVSADELFFVSVAVDRKDLQVEIADFLRRRVFSPALVGPHIALVNVIRAFVIHIDFATSSRNGSSSFRNDEFYRATIGILAKNPHVSFLRPNPCCTGCD